MVDEDFSCLGAEELDLVLLELNLLPWSVAAHCTHDANKPRTWSAGGVHFVDMA